MQEKYEKEMIDKDHDLDHNLCRNKEIIIKEVLQT